MKKKIFYIVLLGIITLSMTGCLGGGTTPPAEKLFKTVITANQLDTMEEITGLAFVEEKEELAVSDFTEEKKSEIARFLIKDKALEEVSGSSMTQEFQKYFGEDQTIEFTDVKCNMEHDSEEEQTIYIFDKEKDKYVYNEKHPGHGGGGTNFIGSKIKFESLEVEGNTYQYKVKILFYGNALCYDIGGCEYGKGYKSYKDAKNETNPLLTIDENEKYLVTDWDSGFQHSDLEKVMDDYFDQLDTYQFIFYKNGDNLVFKEYKKS
ncbi:MAG: hypothetical protein J6X28_04310 [Bacilli bacterium]|nr:hypothetical protein [Bacilli bacterium]